MKNSIRLLQAILLLCLMSCKPISMMIAKKTGEFIEPEQETYQSIKANCLEKNVNFDQLFVLKSEDQFKTFISKHGSIPSIFVFDKNKYLVTTAEKSDCPWVMINFLYDTAYQLQKTSDTALYSEIMSNFVMIEDRSPLNQADYYILCTWAKFVPKHTDALFETINKQKKENKLNVCHVLLNVDLQKSWESDN